jgi:hypothetical protein
MKSAFLITATMLSGIVGVFSIPTAAGNTTTTPQSTGGSGNSTTAHNTSSFHTTNSQSPSPPANVSTVGPGPKDTWMCWSIGEQPPRYAVEYGITEKDAQETAQSKCGSGCAPIACANNATCVGVAYGSVEHEHEAADTAVVIDAVFADTKQARIKAEGVALRICKSLIDGDCHDLGSACIN